MDLKEIKVYENMMVPNENYFFISWDYYDFFNCSNSFEEITGYSSKEISQMEFKHHSLIEGVDSGKTYNSILEFFSQNEIKQLVKVYKILSKTEKPIWFKEFISVNQKNDKKQYSSLLVDISDIKQKEEELNSIALAKTELNNSKDKLISIISHDLRAPFTSLLGFSEILINERELPEKERVEYLEYIHEASKIQLQMVNHLLDWTKLQTGTMSFEPRRIEIRDIIDNCISVLTGVAMRKNIEIKVFGGKGVFVNVDEKLMNQVITNLLSNAVKFTPSDKTIKVTVDYYKKDMVEVIVKDEGIGISESNQMKLFRVDTKFSLIGTAGEKGSGLGLSLVKEIVEKHSGKIWLYSEINKGSEFHFVIPKAEDIILIVEEYEEIQKEYLNSFRTKFSNYEITFLKTGFEAMNYITDKTPSIVILYHDMPLMSGVQLISSLRKKDSHNKVSVVVLVDKLNEDEKKQYKKLKVENFVDFNSTPQEIAEKISFLSP